MPYNSGAEVATAQASFTVSDMSGKNAVTVVGGLDASVTAGMVDSFATALGNATNGALTRKSYSVVGTVPVASQVTFDEAFAGAEVKAIFIFQDAALSIRKFSVAAPDASLFYDGYKQVKSVADSTLVAALVSGFLALVNAGGGSYSFVKAFREGFAQYATPNVTVTEPGTGSSPPQLPASEPA